MSINELRGRIRALRGSIRRLHALSGTARLAIALVVAITVSFILDWSLVLPVGVRTLLLFLSITALLTVIYKGLLRPLFERLHEEDLALRLEKRYPELKDGLISSLQFARQASGEEFGESVSLQNAVIADTVERSRSLDFPAVADSPRAYRIAALAFSACLVPAALLAFSQRSREYASIWWKRNVALSREASWPRQTFLEVYFREDKDTFLTQQGPMTVVNVAQGDDLTLCVKANGTVPQKVTLFYRAVSGDSKAEPIQESKVMAQVGERDFQYALVGLDESLLFHVEGGDDRDGEPIYLIRVLPTPRVESLTLSLTYPPYMRRERETTTEGNLRVPIGTRVDLLVRTNMKVRAAALNLDREAPRPLESVEEMTYQGGFVVSGDVNYSIALTGEHGLSDRRPLRFTVKGLPDEAPKVTPVSPNVFEFDATPEAVLLVKTVASDDNGLSEVTLRLKPPRSELATEISLMDAGTTFREDGGAFEPGSKRAISVRTLEIKAVPGGSDHPSPEVGDTFFFHVEARDEKTGPGGEPAPNVGRCQEFRVSVTSRVDLERKLSDWQLRIKEDVKKLRRLQDKSKSDLDFFLTPEETLRPLDPAERQKLLDIEIVQNRTSTDSKRLTTDFVHLFDAYLFNRVEKSSFADRLLATLVEAAREPRADAWAGYRKLTEGLAPGAADESEILGKLLGMVASGLSITEKSSPEAARAITTARLLPEGADRLPALKTAQEKQQAILDELDRLLKKMDEWEDYQGILDAMKQLIEDQKAIKNRTLSEINRKTKPEVDPNDKSEIDRKNR